MHQTLNSKLKVRHTATLTATYYNTLLTRHAGHVGFMSVCLVRRVLQCVAVCVAGCLNLYLLSDTAHTGETLHALFDQHCLRAGYTNTATHCNTLQLSAAHCITLHMHVLRTRVLQTITHCNTLQHSAMLRTSYLPSQEGSTHSAAQCITLHRTL